MKSRAGKPKPGPAPDQTRCPTMQDVADAAGCSRSAVSLAFRGDRSIPEPTRRRIQEVATKIGYRTNPLVASLMSLHRRRHPVGGLRTKLAFLSSHPPGAPWRDVRAYREMFEGAQERAREVDCAVEEFDLAAPGMSPVRMRSILHARGIHGVIVGPLFGGAVSLDFDFTGLAAVGLGMSLVSPLIERVANDHSQSAALSVRKCAELGYRRIGFAVSHATSVRLDLRWLAGYRAELDQIIDASPIPPLATPTAAELPSALPGWIKAHAPEVIILGNVEPEILEKIPPSIGMVLLGVDDEEGPFAGIYQNYRLIGRSVTERVISLLYTNNFDRLTQPVLHLIGGTWAPGLSAPGPGKRRPFSEELARLKAARTQRV